MKQILLIGGGESFETEEKYFEYLRTVKIDPYQEKKSWKDWLKETLKETHITFIPSMPCKENARYEAWKLWFEKYFEFITDERPILVGYSLGTTFLLKWLTENKFPKQISQLNLIASYVINDGYLENLGTFGFDQSKMNLIKDFCDEVHIWHSQDDPITPFENGEVVNKNIPGSVLHTFENRNHFFQPEFPELATVILALK